MSESLEDICLRALELAPELRSAYLRSSCPDEQMRAQAESLLAAADYADAVFERPPPFFNTAQTLDSSAAANTHPDPASLEAGLRIGPYELLERLGEGGMGVVYRARQLAPVRREVAIKIIRQGMDTGLVAARFEAERQALSLMDHPNIARVLDAGTTKSDRAYFVMELVSGSPVTQYADSRRLTIAARFRLMAAICDAIHHAHQKGVIHRDIKPSNILVVDSPSGPVPKVIDFGIAKAMVNPLHDGAPFTMAFDIVGTLGYMSPEQADPGGRGVDVRSDVYSLGAVLYELLAGQPSLPGISLREIGFAAVLKRIQEETPAPPSLSVRDNSSHNEEIAAARGCSPRGGVQRLVRQLAGECDWIVRKAMEKAPSQRYQTASALGRDLERYLDGDALEAGPPSAFYRVSRLARRHRAWVATAAAFILVLVAATLFSVREAVRATAAEQLALTRLNRANEAERAAREERDRAIDAERNVRQAQKLTLQERARADSEASAARAVASFLQDDLLKQASPAAQAGPAKRPDPNLTVRQALDQAAGTLDGRFPQQPLVRASLEHTIAGAYQGLGLYKQEAAHALKAMEIRKQVLGPYHPSTMASMDLLASAYRVESQFPAAEKIWTELYGYQRKALGESHPATLQSMHGLASLYRTLGKYKESVALNERTLQLRRKALGPENPDTLRTASNLAYAYSFVGKQRESANLQAETLAIRRRILGPEHPETLMSMSNLANGYQSLGRYQESRALVDQTLEIQRRTLGPGHAQTLATVLNLGLLQNETKAYEDAVLTLRAGLEQYRRIGAEKSQGALVMANNLAVVYIALEKYQLATDIFSRALVILKETMNAENPDTVRTVLNLGNAYRLLGRYGEAEPLIRQAIEIRRRTLGEEAGNTMHANYRLAELLFDTGRYQEAEALASKVWELRRKRLGEMDASTVDTLILRARVAVALRKDAEAQQLGAQALATLEKRGKESPATPEVLELLARNAKATGHPREAAAAFETALAARQRLQGPAHPATLRNMKSLADCLDQLGEAARAKELRNRWQTLQSPAQP